MFVIQPLAADDSVQHVTALQFKGAPDMMNAASETTGSVGPAGLLLADDFEMYERCHRGVLARNPEWIFLGRGERREGATRRVSGGPRHRRGAVARYWASLSQPDGGTVMLSRESSATLMSAV